jgi:hypothetical protein
MAWEWVAPVATASLGVVGIYFTWRTGKEGRDHAKQLAKAQQDHSERAAATARTQQRKAEAYVQILEVVEQIGNWAQNIRRVMDTIPPREIPPVPEYQDQIASKARLLAFASPEVQALWDEWDGAVHEIRVADMKIALGQQPNSAFDDTEAWISLEDTLRPKEIEQRKLLAEQVSRELSAS